MTYNKAAREETVRYHENYYSSHKLFQEGWLAKSDEELPRIITWLAEKERPAVLDIGCGVGRNAIAIAKELKSKSVTVDCYDMLDKAIELLCGYAVEYDVADGINGCVVDMDTLEIEYEKYDAILAISVLEHSKSIELVQRMLNQMASATQRGGCNRITISTDRCATACDTGDPIDTRVETPMSRDQVETMLKEVYADWLIDRLSLVPYKEELQLEGRSVIWTCTDVSFLARKK